MSKRMNKERAKEVLKKIKEINYREEFFEVDRVAQALDIAIDSLDNEWVDVRDRLPSEEDLVKAGQYGFYITVQYGKLKRVEEADYDLDTKEWNYNREFSGEEVIAWRHELRPYERKERE